jgi:hypothetical protein
MTAEAPDWPDALAMSPDCRTPPSAMTGTSSPLAGPDGVHDRGDLGHPHAGDDAGGADRARADAHLDRVGPGGDERLGALFGRDVPGDDVDVVTPTNLLQGPDHVLAVAVGGVDDDHVDLGIDKRLHAIQAA